MVVTTVMVKVKSEHIGEFITECIKNHEMSINEPGNRRFDILQCNDDPAAFLLYEAYDSIQSATAHKQTAHYAAWRDTVAQWMAEPRKGISYTALRP